MKKDEKDEKKEFINRVRAAGDVEAIKTLLIGVYEGLQANKGRVNNMQGRIAQIENEIIGLSGNIDFLYDAYEGVEEAEGAAGAELVGGDEVRGLPAAIDLDE